jgi:prepilin-type N-terminal cleavage/methylation domain-containing protein
MRERRMVTRAPLERLRALLRADRGFTLIEVTVAATLLVVGVLGTLTLLDGANRATSRTKTREAGINLAREAIEAVRAVPYPDLLPSTIDGELKAQPGLSDSSAAAGWQVVRRGRTFTLIPSVCSVDDGTVTADGYGDHTGGTFCSDSTTTGTTDSNPDDYKRVKIDVTWKDKGVTRTARQEAVINNPGSAFAPAVKTLTSTPVTPITSSATASVGFSATTSSKAQRFTWGIDNVEQGTGSATSSAGTGWTFNWNISSVSDGTYLVNAQAYDQFGETGAGRVLTMQLNRFAPATPTGLTGGPNVHFSVAEFEWNPNPERDVVGYRLYRMSPLAVLPSTSDTLVCTTSVDDAAPTSCRDSSPPSGNYRYYVVALAPARTGGGLEESARPVLAGTLLLGSSNAAPTEPGSVSITSTTDGNKLTWTAGSDSDGTIRYYRVYRDDGSIAGRLDRTASGAVLTLTDPAGGSGHKYWVTAVDNQLAESPFAPSGGITSP